MPPLHTWSSVSSRRALRKYFATWVGNGFGGSWP
jgi:hypothetical protein